jgi:PhnB protein
MASKAVKPIPAGYHTVTPFLNVKGLPKLIDFLKSAFGAEELMRMPSGDAAVHAEVNIGNSRIMLGEIMQPNQPSSMSYFYVYVADADSAYKRAIGAGASTVSEPADQFWGDRMGTVKDPYGNHWSLATHKEDPTPEEMAKRMAAMGR